MSAFGERLGVGPADRVLQFCSPSCDISLAETLTPLVTGGSVVLRSGATPSPDELAILVEEHSITWLDLPTAYWHELGRCRWTPPAQLRIVVIGGDRVTAGAVRAWTASAGHDVALFNGYGPTEASVTTLLDEIDLDADEDPPVGTPLGHVQVAIVDHEGRPVESGTAGELIVGGRGVALGYHGLSSETRRRFVASAVVGGHAAFRTGDMVREGRDSRFRYVGRHDDQVKVAGFRVELGEVEAVASMEPSVGRAVAVACEEGALDRCLAVYLELDGSEAVGASAGGSADAASQALIEEWRAVYDENAATGAPADPEFDIHGWRSSIDHRPIPSEDMREWVDETVALIDVDPDDAVLEIGCGTGLLLHPIARTCARYVGTDISPGTLRRLERSVARYGPRVELACCEATDMAAVTGTFDVVVMNSVTQHFPSADYLREALGQAVTRCRPGGRIIVGDVRSLPLLDAFHQRVASRQHADASPGEIDARARASAEAEEELLVAPSWFVDAAARFDGAHVAVTPKRGRAANEVVDFRYDVVITPGLTPRAVDRWVRWSDVGSWSAFDRELRAAATEQRTVGFVDIPNQRVLGALEDDRAVHPDDARLAAAARGLRCETSWRASGADGSVDLVVSPDGAPADFSSLPVRWDGPAHNDPTAARLHLRRRDDAVTGVRRRLTASLPPAVVPPIVEIIDHLPLTPVGKVDRVALAQRARTCRTGGPRLAAPSAESGMVARLVAIATELLATPDFDASSSFFEHGGSSLAAMRLVARIQSEVGVRLSPGDVFAASTMEELALTLGRAAVAGPPPTRRPRRDGPIGLTATQQRLWLAQQLAGDDTSLVIPAMTIVRSAIDPVRFAAACRTVAGRHETLHARVAFGADEVEQWFDLGPEDVVVDLAHEQDEAAAIDHATAWAFRPFDLERGPLVRFLLVSAGDGCSLVAVAIHHLAADFTGLRLVVDELLEVALVADPARSSLLPVGVDLGDVAAWERAAPPRPAAAERREWERRLRLPQPRSLPGDALGGRISLHSEAVVLRLAVPPDLVVAADQLAVSAATTRFVTLLTAHLLAVASGTPDGIAAVAVPVSGREVLELEAVVGPVMNLVVVAVGGDDSTAGTRHGALDGVHRAFIDALGGQRTPYREICAAAPADWERTEGGVVDALVQHLTLPRPHRRHGVVVEPLDDPGVVTRFPIEIIFEDRGGADLTMRSTINPSVVDETSARNHAALTLRALGLLTADPAAPWTSILDRLQPVTLGEW
jgi:acyl-CoA synthetase (AMP-forming)/AMP-acid ligase II/acyl carrier protein